MIHTTKILILSMSLVFTLIIIGYLCYSIYLNITHYVMIDESVPYIFFIILLVIIAIILLMLDISYIKESKQ